MKIYSTQWYKNAANQLDEFVEWSRENRGFVVVKYGFSANEFANALKCFADAMKYAAKSISNFRINSNHRTK